MADLDKSLRAQSLAGRENLFENVAEALRKVIWTIFRVFHRGLRLRQSTTGLWACDNLGRDLRVLSHQGQLDKV